MSSTKGSTQVSLGASYHQCFRKGFELINEGKVKFKGENIQIYPQDDKNAIGDIDVIYQVKESINIVDLIPNVVCHVSPRTLNFEVGSYLIFELTTMSGEDVDKVIQKRNKTKVDIKLDFFTKLFEDKNLIKRNAKKRNIKFSRSNGCYFIFVYNGHDIVDVSKKFDGSVISRCYGNIHLSLETCIVWEKNIIIEEAKMENEKAKMENDRLLEKIKELENKEINLDGLKRKRNSET
jgi:hypothetical protein